MLFHKTGPMVISKFSLLVLLGNILMVAEASAYCYSNDKSPYRYYSTKTKYEIILNRTQQTHSDTNTIDRCEPSVFYLLSRHGSRYPGDDDISLMTERLPQIREFIFNHNESFCTEDLAALKNWQMHMVESDDNMLAPVGRQELKGIAERYKSSYPGLLNVPYNDSKIQIWHSEKVRTRDSARAFAEGLYGSYENVTIVELKESEDWLLRYYKNCEKYEKTTETLVEGDNFKNGPEMANVLSNVRSRLDMNDLTFDDMIDVLYEVCRYEYELFNISPWCMAFTEDDLKVIEYLNDIGYYWEDGYGKAINYEQTCGLLKDIQDHLDMTDPESNQPSTFNVLTRFGHSATMNSLFARLGLFKDDYQITASNYNSSADRQWRTSLHTPMASNIAFVRYSCTDGTEDKVAVYLNEELVTLPISGCSNGICTAEALNTAWDPITSECNLEEICSMDNDVSSSSRIETSAVFIIILLVFYML